MKIKQVLALLVPVLAVVLLTSQVAAAAPAVSPVAAVSSVAPIDPPGIRPAEQVPPPAPVGIVDVVFVLTTIAFFKAQFGLKGWRVIAAAGAVCLVVGLGPQLQEALPFLTGWFDAVIGIFQLLMYTAGGYDLVTDVGPKVITSLHA